MGQSQIPGGHFPQAVSVRRKYTQVRVCVFLGLRLCFPKCLLYPDQRENLTYTRSSSGRATGEILSWLLEMPGRREDHLLPHMNRWWLGVKGVEETWLYLSDSAGDRCALAMELSTGVCLVCEEARTQRCAHFSLLY